MNPDNSPNPEPSINDVPTPQVPQPSTVIQPTEPVVSRAADAAQPPVAPVQPQAESQLPVVPPTPTKPVQDQVNVAFGAQPPQQPTEPSVYQQPAQELYTPTSFEPKKSKKPLFVALGVLLAVILTGGAYALFFYIPNRPENVWKTGMDRSGDALEELVSKATDQGQIDKYKRSEINAEATVTGTEEKQASAKLNAKYDEGRFDGSLDIDVDIQDLITFKSGVDVLSEIPDGETYPYIFLRLYGLKDISKLFFIDLSRYENKWIYASPKYFEKELAPVLGDNLSEADTSSATAGDVAAVAGIVASTSSEYLFTPNEQNAVLMNKEFIAKEDLDGVQAYHYKVGINKNNAVNFCKAIVENVTASENFKRLAGNPSEDEMQRYKDSAKDCESIKDETEDEPDIELWIDSKYKVITKARIFEPNSNDKYVDIGQRYTGGDELPVYIDFANSMDDAEVAKLTLTTNFATGMTRSDLEMKGGSGDGSYTAKAFVEVKPLEEELRIEAPKKYINVKDVIRQLSTPTVEQPLVLGENTDDPPFGPLVLIKDLIAN